MDTKKYTFDLIKVKPLSGVNTNKTSKKKSSPTVKGLLGARSLFPKKFNKGTKLKDILGDKKGTVVYKGKNKNYRMTIPVAPKPKKG